MERVAKFLKEAETYYLATVEGDQPRVRPFGTVHIFEGKLYIQTGKVKGNPEAEAVRRAGGDRKALSGGIGGAAYGQQLPVLQCGGRNRSGQKVIPGV